MDRRKTDRRTNEAKDPYSFDLHDLAAILVRRKWLIAFLSLAALIPGMFHVATKPVMYGASSSILLEETDYGLADLQDAMGAARLDEAAFDTQISILKSPRLIQETLSDIHKDKPVSQGAIASFYNKLTIDSSGRSRVLTISYRSENAEETAAVVNTHVQNFIDYRIDAKQQQIDVINDWLNGQLAKLKEDSQKKGLAIKEFRGESTIILGPNAQNIIYDQISELTSQLVPIETKKLELQSKIDALESGQASSLPDVTRSTLIEQLKTQLSQARQELRAAGATLGPNHPQRRAAEKRVAQLQAEIGAETGTIRKSLTMELESVTKQEQLLNARIEELNTQANQMQDQSITMEDLQGELEANRKILVSYMDKFQEVKTRMDLSRSDVRVLNTADVPVVPSSMGKTSLAILVLMLSFAFGIIATLLLEFVDRGIEDENDIKNVLKLRLLGTLPYIKNPLSILSSKGRNSYTEELKRIYLLLAARGGSQTILVTSAESEEGKTTTALSIARYLASIRARVILIDADTIKPSIATITGTASAPGLAEILAGDADYTKIIKRDEDGLAIIPSGDQARYPIDILASNALDKILESLKSQYDFILIDSAGVLSCTDAEVLSGKVDMVIAVIEWKRIARKKLQTVTETLRQYSRDIPHVILNKRR